MGERGERGDPMAAALVETIRSRARVLQARVRAGSTKWSTVLLRWQRARPGAAAAESDATARAYAAWTGLALSSWFEQEVGVRQRVLITVISSRVKENYHSSSTIASAPPGKRVGTREILREEKEAMTTSLKIPTVTMSLRAGSSKGPWYLDEDQATEARGNREYHLEVERKLGPLRTSQREGIAP